MIQLKNRVVRLQNISFAEISFPEEHTENDWIELYLIVGNRDIIITGDDALVLWTAITERSIPILPPDWEENSDPLPIPSEEVIASAVSSSMKE